MILQNLCRYIKEASVESIYRPTEYLNLLVDDRKKIELREVFIL
jgi:hypothetical protein